MLEKHFAGIQNVTMIKMDVTSKEDIEAAKILVSSKVSKLDGIVNSAGVPFAPRYPVSWVQGAIEVDVDEHVKPVLDINLLGTMRINSALFPLLWEARGSTVVNICSLGGVLAVPGMGAYHVSKFGLMGYSDTLRRELAPYKIRVVSLEPGFVKTGLAHDIFSSQDLDYSHTRLFAGRGDHPGTLSYEKLPPPSIVTEKIHELLFLRPHDPVPHLIIDTLPLRLRWWLILHLPYTWADYLIEGGSQRADKVRATWR